MKKLLAAIAVGAAVASPYLIGIKTEQQLNDLYQRMSANPSVNIEIAHYQRGWFYSAAQIHMSMPVTDDQGNVTEISFQGRHDIQHGPLLWTADGLGFGLADSVISAQLLTEIQQQIINFEQLPDDTVSSVMRTHFGGETDTIMKIKPVTVELIAASLHILPGLFTGTMTPAGEVTTSGQWQGMKIVEDDREVLRLGNTELEIAQHFILSDMFSPASLAIGSVKFSLAEAAVLGESDADSMSINDLSVYSESAVENELMVSQITADAKDIRFAGQQFTDFNYVMSMENMNINVISKLKQLLVELQSDDPEQQQLLVTGIQQQIPHLLVGDPKISIDNLSVNTSAGPIESDLKITVDPQKFDANNPVSMMFAVQAVAHGSAPVAFFEDLGMQANIDDLMQQGVIIRDANRLILSFAFRDGQARINGHPMPAG
ncbi:DUF945 family protein [Thalassotalea mangrovi]|uniref:DUF945 domain-containing protein n=1 Tax=Thalassotalea mangrovi TaxID=2572245 RepID=A0A4U1B5D4_9GAMM|nr:DUF945 family protein [Thalassotalea mangrovi]TKB45604.1 DUF945 domain-containing protein [Thalassotalea mangrovi]